MTEGPGTGSRAPGTIAFISDREIDYAVPVAVKHVRARGLLAHPTETVYGFGTTIDELALQGLSALKQRNEAKPFVVLVADRSMLGGIAAPLSRHAAAMAERFWPGALTLVLEPRGQLPRALLGPTGGVAVRWSSHAGMQRLLVGLGAPLTSTSANVAALPPARTAQEIETQWSREIAGGDLLVLDGGRLSAGSPSTIVDCTGAVPRVIRPGAVSVDQLRAVVPELVGA
jgi:L-threonylcarbamoyladenylate synthase